MSEPLENPVKVSVRSLVEFILRSGDIDNRHGGMRDSGAMQEGSRIHRKIQRSMGGNYEAEVPLSVTLPVSREGVSFRLTVEGRADGIITAPFTTVDEIKGVYRSLNTLKEPVPIHRYQALCYAYIYALRHKLDTIGVQITYCHLITEEIRRFPEMLHFSQLETWFLKLVEEYGKWIAWQMKWRKIRDASLFRMPFPFPYRKGQKEFAEGVYSAIYHRKKLYLQAPTGTGKTMSTLYPAVMSLSTGLSERIFYLTAKTVTRTVAEEAVSILLHKNRACLKSITITAKEKLCPFSSGSRRLPCNPVECGRAKGHFDRVNDAVFELLNAGHAITRETILSYAEKHSVCPFEMALDTALWCDIIICDYNYLFDPNIYLKRFFSGDRQAPYVFLIDEAHNLVERARDMYTAVLYKEEFLEVLPYVSEMESRLPGKLSGCDRAFLHRKKECDGFTVLEDIQNIAIKLMELLDELEIFLQNHIFFGHRDEVLELYFRVRHFLNIYNLVSREYRIYGNYEENGRFFITLRCMDPSKQIGSCLLRGVSSIFFSATLLPMGYYREQLGGTKEDYALYLPSPFPAGHSCILLAREVSTRYTKRIEEEFLKIAEYILAVFDSRRGNYMVFFPSYQMMETLFFYLKERNPDIRYLCQKPSMSEWERELFLNAFEEDPEHPVLALCILGGIFSEGIDLKGTRLIGTIIAGPGLPMVCEERELYRSYFDENGKNGFDYAYLYPGLNKVLQAAGRVIRTDSDRGVILLLDERFLTDSYTSLFPPEWKPCAVTLPVLKRTLREFWEREP